MKKSIAMVLMLLILTACTTNQNELSDVGKNFEGEYKDPFILQFANTVHGGSYRRGTGNVFVRGIDRNDRAIEIFPGDVYNPDLPKRLKAGYTAEILLEQVNRHGEDPKVIYSKKTTNLEEAKVDIPNEQGKLYRYTILVRDANGKFMDIRYDPLFTTFEKYNMVINVMKPKYKKNELITVNIENWGPNHVSFSNDWTIYKRTNNKWKKVEPTVKDRPMTLEGTLPSAWNMGYLNVSGYATLLSPGSNQTIVLRDYSLKPGTYKIQGLLGSAKHTFHLEDTFEVIN